MEPNICAVDETHQIYSLKTVYLCCQLSYTANRSHISVALRILCTTEDSYDLHGLTTAIHESNGLP